MGQDIKSSYKMKAKPTKIVASVLQDYNSQQTSIK